MSVHDFRWLEAPNFTTLRDSTATTTKGNTTTMPTHFVNASHMTIEPAAPLTPNFTVSSYDKFMVFQTKDAELFRITAEGEVYVRGKLTANDIDLYQSFKLWFALAQVAERPADGSPATPPAPEPPTTG